MHRGGAFKHPTLPTHPPVLDGSGGRSLHLKSDDVNEVTAIFCHKHEQWAWIHMNHYYEGQGIYWTKFSNHMAAFANLVTEIFCTNMSIKHRALSMGGKVSILDSCKQSEPWGEAHQRQTAKIRTRQGPRPSFCFSFIKKVKVLRRQCCLIRTAGPWGEACVILHLPLLMVIRFRSHHPALTITKCLNLPSSKFMHKS